MKGPDLGSLHSTGWFGMGASCHARYLGEAPMRWWDGQTERSESGQVALLVGDPTKPGEVSSATWFPPNYSRSAAHSSYAAFGT